MMNTGLIIGSGVEFGAIDKSWREISTPYGMAFMGSTTINSIEVALIRRHGPGLNIPPHLINYHANIWALKEAGVNRIISTAAVGSLNRDLPPGSLAIVADFVDFTKNKVTTIYDRPLEKVVHTDFSTPYCPNLSRGLKEASVEVGAKICKDVTYICVDGPRYETPAEIKMFSAFGDVIGMTGAHEAILAREMGICYASLAIITNYAAGISDRPLSHDEVLTEVKKLGESVTAIISKAAAQIPERDKCCGI